MSQPDPAEQLAREIAREAAYLPERWRAWLFEQLRKDFASVDMEKLQIDRLNQKMREAVEVLERVARHLKLSDEQALASLTMRQFDAAPNKAKQGWKARQIADAVRGSWRLAKSVAFAKANLPVAAERKAELRRQMKRKRTELAFASLSYIRDWLATKPSSKSGRTYSAWIKERNERLAPGQLPAPQAAAITTRWGLSWPEIVKLVEDDQMPDQADEAKPEERAKVKKKKAAAKNYVLDSQLRSDLIRSSREARGWSIRDLARHSGLDGSNVAKLERDEISNPSFETIVKLAIALDLPLDDFAIQD